MRGSGLLQRSLHTSVTTSCESVIELPGQKDGYFAKGMNIFYDNKK